MSRRILARGLLLGLCTAATASLGPSSPSSALAAPVGAKLVRVTPLDGAPVEGAFVGVDAKGLRIEGREAPVPLADIREARFAPEAPVAPLPDGGVGLRVVLRGDEVIRGTLVGGGADDLEVRPVGLAALKVPFDSIRRVETEAPDRSPCEEPGRVRPPRPGTDVAYARSGDAFPGTLVGADAAGLTLDDKGDKHTVRWADLVVLHLDEPALPPEPGLVMEVETLGGTVLRTTAISGDAAGVAVKTRSGVEVTVPREALAVVRFSGGRFVYASDLPFTSKFTPYYGDDLVGDDLAPWYGARADRSVRHGCPLRIAGVPYRHGIAVHAKSAVTVPLGKAFVRFEARFGIDDEALGEDTDAHGDVTARVLADGREVWTSGGSVRGGQAAKVVGPIDVTGVESLVLEVDFGGELHVNDRADWADPVLVRAK